ncbi:MAG: methyltransferase [Planctomycetota bacterium]|nr:methyltransferase [Planctomycetota bacterium]
MANPDPSKIMQVGFGFWSSKVLLIAVKDGVFSELGSGEMTGEQIGKALELHPRGIYDFLDSLVALGFLDREGNGAEGRYRNTPETALFLDKNSPQYIGGILEMCNDRLYAFWGDLGEGLRTGKPQNEIKHTGKSIFEELYSDPDRTEHFMNAMAGISRMNFQALAEKFDFSRYKTVCDIGGANGLLSITLAKVHPDLRCTTIDLPVVEPIARKKIEEAGVSDRVSTAGGDFFEGPFPKADVITMGNVLHDWNLEKKKKLIRSAYDALPDGGAYIIIENIIDDERRQNLFGLLMSLNMLIEIGDGFDFTGEDFRGWCKEAGFSRFDQISLGGPASAGVAYK